MRDVEPIRQALRMRPFRAFTLKLADGSEHTIEHADWVSVPPVQRPREITVYAVRGAGEEEEDYRTHWVDVGLVSQVIVPGRAELHRAPAAGEAGEE